MSEQCEGKIELKLLYSDQNLLLANQSLTDEKGDIPKFIQLNQKFVIECTWKPRPKIVQELLVELT